MPAKEISVFSRLIFPRNCLHDVGALQHLCYALVCLLLTICFQSLANAQQQPQETKPFIEPAEMAHERAALRVFKEASPHLNGKWETLPFLMPINPVHVALMHNQKSAGDLRFRQ